MESVPRTEYKSTKAYYIPHHCVMKPESVSTKLRVVLDASAKTSNGLSLNDTLLTGQKLQKDISTILLFRLNPIVFICDIKAMYRQIKLEDDYHDYQRIIWRFSSTEPLQEFRITTVAFGVASSPFLALRTLQELAVIYEKEYPKAAHVLKNTVFVDDILAGAGDVTSALALQNELINLLKLGGFELRKFASNHLALLTSVPSEHTQMSLSFDKEEPSFIKVLGVQWIPNSDSFSFSFTPVDSTCTKRNVLSLTARLYDPLGFISPIIFAFKHVMQQMWLSNISWDESPSHDTINKWNALKGELHLLSSINLPRFILPKIYTRLELHTFCDASSVGYAGVVYFRIELPNKTIQTFLICAKSRVAPIKKMLSLPKLELAAAVLAADLVSFVKSTYAEYVIFDEVYAWSDSQVALTWIGSSPHRWKTFVANRTSHVQQIIPPKSWRYVPSAENAADVGSRGCTPLELINHPLWWYGPSWLKQPSTTWPPQLNINSEFPDSVLESKPIALTTTIDNQANFQDIPEGSMHFIDKLLQTFSSLIKIQRIIARFKRYLHNKKNPQVINSGSFKQQELQKALLIVVKYVQSQSFQNVFDVIKKK